MKTRLAQIIALTLGTALTSTVALASDLKIIKDTIDVTTGQTVSFNVPVGSLKIKTCDCDQISVKVKVEPKDSDWSFFSSGNVDDAKLQVKQRNNSVKLSIDDEDTKQKWTVTMPADSNLNVDLGVGELKVREFNQSLDADVGVGSITVDVTEQNYDSIKLESGVGATDIDGFDKQAKTTRAMVSSTTKYRGEGEHSIKVDVGVGDARIIHH